VWDMGLFSLALQRPIQGRPVRAKHDAQMHHGQNRAEARKLGQKS